MVVIHKLELEERGLCGDLFIDDDFIVFCYSRMSNYLVDVRNTVTGQLIHSFSVDREVAARDGCIAVLL